MTDHDRKRLRLNWPAGIPTRTDDLEGFVRSVVKPGMDDCTLCSIEFISGFELFNARFGPYFGYETWDQGWRVSGRGQKAEHPDLAHALAAWAALVAKAEGRAPSPQGGTP